MDIQPYGPVDQALSNPDKIAPGVKYDNKLVLTGILGGLVIGAIITLLVVHYRNREEEHQT